MKTALFWKWARIGLLTAALAVSPLWQTPAEETDIHGHGPGIHLELTEAFYRALREEAGTGGKVYDNRPDGGYLREIAVSTRFMVETNLRILAQQEKIIQLLESAQAAKK